MLVTSKMQVCVTGGAGFIGSEITRQLLGMGHNVTVIDDLSSRAPAPIPMRNLRFVRGSVLDRKAVLSAVRGADLILHLAGVVGMRLAYERRDLSYQISTLGTKLVIESARGVPIVATSSSAVYGDTAGKAMCESDLLDSFAALRYDGGTPGYALGKLHLEDIVKQSVQPGLCLRPFNVVGRGQVSTYGMVVPTLVERALAGKSLTVYDDGLQTRCFSDIETFVSTLLRIIATPKSWQVPDRTLNIGTIRSTTILSLARQVISQTKSASSIQLMPYSSAFPGRQDIRERVPDVRRLHSIVGPISWASTDSIIQQIISDARFAA